MIESFYLLTGGAILTGAGLRIGYEVLKYRKFNKQYNKFCKVVEKNERLFNLIKDKDIQEIADSLNQLSEEELIIIKNDMTQVIEESNKVIEESRKFLNEHKCLCSKL
jgi:N-glycosylase/DNA lyase